MVKFHPSLIIVDSQHDHYQGAALNKNMNRLLLLLLPLSVSPSFAQDFLDPLIVTATRTDQEASESTNSTTVLDSAFIRESTRRTLPDALQYTPGVLVQKTAHGHGSPFIRGFTGRQNLLLVDGVRINNSTFRGGPVQYWNTVDPLSIERIELIRSQGSVLYGSDAIGGTLNSFTKSSDFRSRTDGETYFGGSSFYEYRSNGSGSHTGRIEMESGVGGKFGVWLGISQKEFGDIKDSAIGLMRGTGYPEEDLDFRFDYAISPESTLTFAHQYVNQDDVSRWHRTLNNPGWNHGGHVSAPGTWNANTYDQERSLTYIRYAGSNPMADAFIKTWTATLSYQDVTDSEFQDRASGSRPIRRSNIDLQTLGADLTLESVIGPGTLVYGFDYYHDMVDSSGSQNNVAGTLYRESLPIADDSTYDLFGLFTQYQWKATDRLEITPGIRYTYARAELGRFTDSTSTVRTDETQNWDSVVGSLRALYRIDDHWKLFGGISQAFRAPNLDDLSGNLTSKASTTTLGSLNVEPEKFITYEVGARRNSENLSIQTSIFYTQIKDVITGVPATPLPGAPTVTANGNDGYIYGIELEGSWRFHPQWTLTGFTAWQEGRNEISSFIGGPVNSSPMTRQLPLTGSLALRWTSESEKYWIEGRVLAAAKEDRITAADQASDAQRIPTGGTPSYFVSSIRAGWQVNEHLDLNCAIENITDEDYRNHGSGQNEAGFGAVIGARVSF
jgi:hemoglobin/transferrin/lactoferrin receptor protein